MKVEIWSDIACPWCYVGKRRFEKAVANTGAQVEVVWRSFELNPQAPAAVQGDYVELLARKYGMPPARAQQMIDEMTARGAAEGVEMDFAGIRPGNTFDAHRLLHHARTQGLQDALKERFFRAYLGENVLLSDRAELARLAEEVGVEGATDVLESDAFAEAVRADEVQAARYGIRGVPFFVLDGRQGVSGAQETVVFEGVLRKVGAVPEGAVCTPEGC